MIHELKEWCIQRFVPQDAQLVNDYVSFNRKRNSIEVTLYYRTHNGEGRKRRVDLEFTLTGQGDVDATQTVTLNHPSYVS
jgi:hypothetical protein